MKFSVLFWLLFLNSYFVSSLDSRKSTRFGGNQVLINLDQVVDYLNNIQRNQNEMFRKIERLTRTVNAVDREDYLSRDAMNRKISLLEEKVSDLEKLTSSLNSEANSSSEADFISDQGNAHSEFKSNAYRASRDISFFHSSPELVKPTINTPQQMSVAAERQNIIDIKLLEDTRKTLSKVNESLEDVRARVSVVEENLEGVSSGINSARELSHLKQKQAELSRAVDTVMVHFSQIMIGMEKMSEEQKNMSSQIGILHTKVNVNDPSNTNKPDFVHRFNMNKNAKGIDTRTGYDYFTTTTPSPRQKNSVEELTEWAYPQPEKFVTYAHPSSSTTKRSTTPTPWTSTSQDNSNNNVWNANWEEQTKSTSNYNVFHSTRSPVGNMPPIGSSGRVSSIVYPGSSYPNPMLGGYPSPSFPIVGLMKPTTSSYPFAATYQPTISLPTFAPTEPPPTPEFWATTTMPPLEYFYDYGFGQEETEEEIVEQETFDTADYGGGDVFFSEEEEDEMGWESVAAGAMLRRMDRPIFSALKMAPLHSATLNVTTTKIEASSNMVNTSNTSKEKLQDHPFSSKLKDNHQPRENTLKNRTPKKDFLVRKIRTLTSELKHQKRQIHQLALALRKFNISHNLLLRSVDKETIKIAGKPKDCSEIRLLAIPTSSSNFIFPIPNDVSYNVACDMTTLGGGWTIIQRRGHRLPSGVEREKFFRTWKEYEDGFGSIENDYWIGLKALAEMTKRGNQELRIELTKWNGEKAYASYRNFRIHGTNENYRLNISGYSGNAGDALMQHSGMPFSTFDADHDSQPTGNCAQECQGAWWYDACYHSNLNGLYADTTDGSNNSGTGIVWYHFTGNYYSLKAVEMKIRNKFLV